MRAIDIIQKKRDGRELSKGEIDTFVSGATGGTWPEYQVSALLMAIFLKGMTEAETARLTHAMAFSGRTLQWDGLDGPVIDKHSTGGVGDKTTIALVPLVAACGVFVPKMSGRGLGHSGGTVDKLESIPGFRMDFSLEEYQSIVKEVGCAIVGQSKEVAPADKKLYALRDVTATVESIPLITASIMSKKIPEGIQALVLDVKCGRGAFMKSLRDARELARLLVRVGYDNNVKTEAIVTAMDAPLGRTVGNALEIKECVKVLKGAGPHDVTDLTLTLSARMLMLGGMVEFEGQADTRVREVLATGRGLEKLRQMIERQGGEPRVVDDPQLLPRAKEQMLVRANRPGYVRGIDAEAVGKACVLLGAGRHRVEDRIDPAVGIVVQALVGQTVREGDALAEVHVNDRAHLEQALAMLSGAWHISDEAPTEMALVIEVMQNS